MLLPRCSKPWYLFSDIAGEATVYEKVTIHATGRCQCLDLVNQSAIALGFQSKTQKIWAWASDLRLIKRLNQHSPFGDGRKKLTSDDRERVQARSFATSLRASSKRTRV